MRTKTMVFSALAAALMTGVTGCGTTVSNPTTAPTPSAPAVSSAAKPTGGAPSGNPDAPSGGGQDDESTAASQQPPTAAPGTSAAPVTSAGAPYGSGHGRCFDLNSRLAGEAVSRLAVPATGPWQIELASDDLISDGCDNTLSWMTVISGNIHPYMHILYFANGTWLGTATAKPYGYTKILGKTKSTVQVQYHWLTGNEALCCPEGGPSVVTFTLQNGRIQTSGQFPPDK
ncbi:LppP/LprE family lipoprotein [Nocardia sp. 2]|uniref:LppP/LprE family lipoprotein n=1 Tax=Nocardia acididurans TaxID=2802282 RepID=A0ABS1M0L7_9NOCA|nr:LppP/LprE family lipoprotein [Nocardia acididurans]MBL1073729.1 LppP/LprE family lipoprotein [Nocardia acididurans]